MGVQRGVGITGGNWFEDNLVGMVDNRVNTLFKLDSWSEGGPFMFKIY